MANSLNLQGREILEDRL